MKGIKQITDQILEELHRDRYLTRKWIFNEDNVLEHCQASTKDKMEFVFRNTDWDTTEEFIDLLTEFNNQCREMDKRKVAFNNMISQIVDDFKHSYDWFIEKLFKDIKPIDGMNPEEYQEILEKTIEVVKLNLKEVI
jgi:hypothetical protein